MTNPYESGILANGTAARRHALAAAQHLANALAALNLTGYSPLDCQRDHAAYGEAFDALTITVGSLWPPAFAMAIIARALNESVSVNTAARLEAEHLYHVAGQRQADTFDDLQATDGNDDPTAFLDAQRDYLAARGLVENADEWMRQTHHDCAVSTPPATY